MLCSEESLKIDFLRNEKVKLVSMEHGEEKRNEKPKMAENPKMPEKLKMVKKPKMTENLK